MLHEETFLSKLFRALAGCHIIGNSAKNQQKLATTFKPFSLFFSFKISIRNRTMRNEQNHCYPETVESLYLLGYNLYNRMKMSLKHRRKIPPKNFPCSKWLSAAVGKLVFVMQNATKWHQKKNFLLQNAAQSNFVNRKFFGDFFSAMLHSDILPLLFVRLCQNFVFSRQRLNVRTKEILQSSLKRIAKQFHKNHKRKPFRY